MAAKIAVVTFTVNSFTKKPFYKFSKCDQAITKISTGFAGVVAVKDLTFPSCFEKITDHL